MGKEAMSKPKKEIQKAVNKQVRNITHEALIAVGLKKKSPLDKAKDFWKKKR